jgi:hypothetical protein
MLRCEVWERNHSEPFKSCGWSPQAHLGLPELPRSSMFQKVWNGIYLPYHSKHLSYAYVCKILAINWCCRGINTNE